MSKSSRRRQRPGYQPSTARPTGTTPPKPTDPAAAGASAAAADVTGTTVTGTTVSAGTVNLPGTPAGAKTSRPASTSARPTTTTSARHGRRERQRAAYQPSFMERNRNAIVVIAGIAGVVLLSVFVFLSASQAAYACSEVWTPAPTPSPAAGATPALGYPQPQMGGNHVAVGTKVTYTYCAPASGQHYNVPGTAGPIPARVYGPNDNVLPQGWIHNLEHGALVVVYQGSSSGATADGQAQFKAFYDAFPPSPVCGLQKGQLGPVIARFDQMSSPFQAIVWGRVLPLQTFDQAQIMAFWNQWGERTNPEQQCAVPSSSPSVTTTPASASPGVSVAPSETPSVAPSTGPSASVAPSPS